MAKLRLANLEKAERQIAEQATAFSNGKMTFALDTVSVVTSSAFLRILRGSLLYLNNCMDCAMRLHDLRVEDCQSVFAEGT